MGNLNFDATAVAPATPFELLPAGEYIAAIGESELKDTSAGTGKYLQVVWQILEGAHEGRKLWQRMNIANPNATAQEIGQRELSAICHAVGVLQVADSTELHDKPCLIKITIRPPRDKYDASNEVKSVHPLDGARPSAPQAPAWTPPPPAAQAPKTAAPWAK